MSVGDSEDPLQIDELPLREQEKESKTLNNEDENGEKSSSALHEASFLDLFIIFYDKLSLIMCCFLCVCVCI